MTIPQLALQAVTALGIEKPAGFDGTFATFHLLKPSDRIKVTNYSRDFVKAHPDLFESATVAVAVQFDSISENEIDDGFDWGDFVSEVGNNADDLILTPVVNVGKTVSFLAYLAPLAIILGLYLFAKGKIKV